MARIRSVKPELWESETVASCTRDARLLLIGLISHADDEGRERGSANLIVSKVFPYDMDIGIDEVEEWLAELAAAHLIVLYVGPNGHRYIAIVNWREHQRIEKPRSSSLPAPPCEDDSGIDPGTIREASREEGSKEGDKERDEDKDPLSRKSPSKQVDQNQPPDTLPAELHTTAELALTRLLAVHAERGGNLPTLRGTGLALAQYQQRDHLQVLHDLEHWALAGNGQGQPVKDWTRTYATFLRRAPVASPSRSGRSGASDPWKHVDALNRRHGVTA